jgi:hypothetical protein
MGGTVRCAAALGGLALLLGTGPLAAQDTLPRRTARVTYVVGASVYVDAGRSDGLTEGSRLDLLRGDTVAAVLRVQYLASHQAACEVERGAGDIAVGELVRFAPAGPPPAPVAAETPARRAPRRTSGPGVHGRLGLRYLRVTGPQGTGVSQPAADLRLEGQTLGATPLGFVADVRARRVRATTAGGASGVEGDTRVYQMALLWNTPGAPLRVTVGRQYATRVAALSLFDGVSVEVNRPVVSVGVLGGAEPEPDLRGVSTEVQDYGGYLGFHNRPGAPATWMVTLGALGSYRAGHANREFAFLQAGLSTRAVSLFASQELDYYRPWKVDAGESRPLSLTSSYASATFRLSRAFSVHGGYDSRRNVRLYRDVTDPVTSFDDSYRRGAWGGFAVTTRAFRLGGEVRTTAGGPAGRATAWSGTAGLHGLTRLALAPSLRMTWYRSGQLDGRLYTLRLATGPFGPLQVDLNGGFRSEHDPLAVPADRRFTWAGADLDLGLGRSWFALLSASHEAGPEGSTDQLYTGLTFRF